MVNTARTAKDFLTDLERRKAKTAKWHPEGEDGESTAVFDPFYEQMVRNAMRYEKLREMAAPNEDEMDRMLDDLM